MQLCQVEHFFNIFVLTFGRDCYCIQQSRPKARTNMFNLTELHFSEVTSFEIGTVVIDIIQFFLLEEKTDLCKPLLRKQLFIYTVIPS